MKEAKQALFNENWGNPELSQLIELSPPQAISWYPQTLGWYLVLAIITSLLIYRLYQSYRQYLANAYRRAAFSELEQLTIKLHSHNLLPTLLRRTALYAYPRQEVASLTGREWEAWLDDQCPHCHFSTTHQGQLERLAYEQSNSLSDEQLQSLHNAIANWIKRHKAAL